MPMIPVKDLLPLNPQDFLVLAVLADGPLHGYRLAREIEERTGGAVGVRPGNLYRVLDRLLQRKLVAEVPPQDSEPGRRDFRITDGGRAALRAEGRLRRRLLAASSGLRELLDTP